MNIGEYHIGDNIYKVSDQGDVYLLDGARIKKFAADKDGYLFYTFHIGDTHKSFRASRIIWEVFNGDIPKGYVVDHINNVRSDNRLCNLQLLTIAENTVKARARYFKLTDSQGKVWEGKNLKEFCKQHQLNHGNICQVLLGKRKSHKGWKV